MFDQYITKRHIYFMLTQMSMNATTQTLVKKTSPVQTPKVASNAIARRDSKRTIMDSVWVSTKIKVHCFT